MAQEYCRIFKILTEHPLKDNANFLFFFLILEITNATCALVSAKLVTKWYGKHSTIYLTAVLHVCGSGKYLIFRISHYSTAPNISKPETENNCSAEGARRVSWLFMKHKQHDNCCPITVLFMRYRLLLLNIRTKLLRTLY